MSAWRPSLCLAAALICLTASAAPADIELRAVRNNQTVAVSDSQRLAAKLIALVESCSVNSTSNASVATWERIGSSDSFVHVVFSKPRTVSLERRDNQGREQRAIREVLLPLPENRWPRYVLVRSGNETVSLTKYNPLTLKEVVVEQDLQLLAVEPYKSLLRVSHAR
jgi:hypothetical protein